MSGDAMRYWFFYCGEEGMPAEHVFKGGLCIYCPETGPSPEALDLTLGERHGGTGRLLSEAEIREAEAERGGRL